MNHLTETQVNEYLDRMLDEDGSRRMEAHLLVCDQCRAQLDELEMLCATLADLPDIAITRDLTPDILSQLPEVPQIPQLWRQPVFIVQSLLTAILLAVSMPRLLMVVQQIRVWGHEMGLPLVGFPGLSEISSLFLQLLTWKPQLNFAIPKFSYTIPSFPLLPTLPFSLDANTVQILLISAGILWVVGNFSLLRSRPGVEE